MSLGGNPYAMDEPTIGTAPVVAVVKTAKKAAKKSKEPKTRLQLYFDHGVRKDLEHYCIDHEITMSDYVNDLVAKTLPKRKK